jgi:uncharacterized phage protein (TIGR01671 family)
MREKKFRAWDKKKNKMFNITEMRWKINGEFIGGGNSWFDNFILSPSEVWSIDIMQYTGLRDKNGKEIYEGDITSSGWQILFCDGMFAPYYDFGRQERIEDIGPWWINCEIIGNIYENPELLEGYSGFKGEL